MRSLSLEFNEEEEADGVDGSQTTVGAIFHRYCSMSAMNSGIRSCCRASKTLPSRCSLTSRVIVAQRAIWAIDKLVEYRLSRCAICIKIL